MVDYYHTVGSRWWIFLLVAGLVFILVIYFGVWKTNRKRRRLQALRELQLERGLQQSTNDPYVSNMAYNYSETTEGYNHTTVIYNHQVYDSTGNNIPMAQRLSREDGTDVPPAYHIAVSPPPKAYDGVPSYTPNYESANNSNNNGNTNNTPNNNVNNFGNTTYSPVGTGNAGTTTTTNTTNTPAYNPVNPSAPSHLSPDPSHPLYSRAEDDGFWSRFRSRQDQVRKGRQRERESNPGGGTSGSAGPGSGDGCGDGGGHGCSGGGGGDGGGGGGDGGGGGGGD